MPTPGTTTRSAARNLPDLLRRVAGVDVRWNPMVPVISMRGFGQLPFSSRVLFLVDGVPQNSANKGGPRPHPVPQLFDLQNVKRIEVIRGPGAALYGEKERGPETFAGLLRQMRRWAIETSDQGPIYLGYRLGHIKSDSRVFRALVYNKGAMVLHMLRRLVGDEVFFTGLRRFYTEWRFAKAGTDDFRKAMEAASNRDLQPFFEGWIYGSSIPRLKVTQQQGETLLLRFEHRLDVVVVPVTVQITYTAPGYLTRLTVKVGKVKPARP